MGPGTGGRAAARAAWHRTARLILAAKNRPTDAILGKSANGGVLLCPFAVCSGKREERIARSSYNFKQTLNLPTKVLEVICLAKDDIARAVLSALGGRSNILTNTVCMTRLRVTLDDPTAVNYEELSDVHNVLGIALRGDNGIEVVFGPRMIDGVYHAFIRLTGIAAGTDALFPMSRQESNMRVQISPSKSSAGKAVPKPDGSAPSHMDEHDISVLEDLFGKREERDKSAGDSPSHGPALLVINGPNLNMLGLREPDLYGKEDFSALLELCKQAARDAGFARCDCYQSNHEGDLVDIIQDAYGVFDGIVINPGAYTHTSVALLDALKAVSIPAVEVHISKVSEREDFRQVSYVRAACIKTIMGLGIEGYRVAIDYLANHLREQG